MTVRIQFRGKAYSFTSHLGSEDETPFYEAVHVPKREALMRDSSDTTIYHYASSYIIESHTNRVTPATDAHWKCFDLLVACCRAGKASVFREAHLAHIKAQSRRSSVFSFRELYQR